ncbi:MAG: hypothetical protein AB7G12_07275 [Thermoanaerobaculia bacterium]
MSVPSPILPSFLRVALLLLCAFVLTLPVRALPVLAQPSADLPVDIVDDILRDFGGFGELRYVDGAADLNGDGRPERLVYLLGTGICGTGGCNLLVFTPDGSGHRRMADMVLTKLPVRVAAGSSDGWRDLIVHVGGGGMESREVVLPFAAGTYGAGDRTASDAELATARILIPQIASRDDARILVPAAESPPAP